MKLFICLFAFISAVFTSGSAIQNRIYKWENKKVTVTLIDKYGTTLGEEIRAQNQREKAYHIYNLLADTGKKINLFICLSPVMLPEKSAEYSVRSLNVKEIENILGLTFSKQEKYFPVYEEERLLHLNWRDNLLELKSDGLSIFSGEEAYNFLGKRKENLLIRDKGKLMYLNKIDWLPVATLKDFTVSNIFRWLDKNTVILYAERDIDGKKFIAIVFVRKTEVELLPDITGTLIDVAVSPDKSKVCSLHFKAGRWMISEYIRKESKWVLRAVFNRRIDLIGIRKNKVICWDRNNQSIFIPGGARIKNIEHLILKTYPEGNYTYGEIEEALVPVRDTEKIVLFYGSALEEKILKIGLRKIEKFGGNPGVWLLPASYKSDVSSLPENLGHVSLSIDNMKIHYDTSKRHLRNIGSIKLKSTVKERNILIFLGALLLVLLISELTKKAREFTK